MNQLNNIDLWEQIIYTLNGSCDSLHSALIKYNAEELEDYMPFLEYLDNEIFMCDSCNWWSPISEMVDNDSWCCSSCAED